MDMTIGLGCSFKRQVTILVSAIASLMLGTAAQAEETTRVDALGSCQGAYKWTKTEATYDDFKFWLGEWLVADTKTGRLLAFDKVTLEQDSCVMRQDLVMLDDRYGVPGTNWRISGTSLNGISPAGKWRQLWIDNAGNNFLLTGGLQADGAMKLESEQLAWSTPDGKTYKTRYAWYWKPSADGTVRNWGFQLSDDPTKEDKPFFDITYHRNIRNAPIFNATTPEKPE